MGKISPEEKIEWVEKIIQNKESVYSVASKIGVHPSSINTWVRNYKSIGTEAFFRKGWTKKIFQEKRKQLLKIILQAKVLLKMSVQNIKLQILISSERGLSSIMVMRY